MKRKASIILVFIFVGCQLMFSQNKVEFLQLLGENVSTQSITYAIKQDSIGNLWIASEEGVLKHNSKFYRIYNTYNGLPEVLSNRTNQIFIDKKQKIWIGLEKGVCLYNPTQDEFELINSNTSINPSNVNAFDEDAESILWVGCYNGLWKVNQKQTDATIENVVSNLNVLTVLVHKNKVLLGTSNGIYTYYPESNQLDLVTSFNSKASVSFMNRMDENLIIGTKAGELFKANFDFTVINKIPLNNVSQIRDVIKKGENKIFVATDGNGLFCLNKDFTTIYNYKEDPNDENSLSSNGVYDLEFNKENILWIATYGGGINYLDSNRLPFQKVQHKLNNKNSLITNFTRSLAKDAKGNFWFGTKNGVSIWNESLNTWKHIGNIDSKNKEIQDIVLALQPDGDYMWVGTYNNGFYKVNINNFAFKEYSNLEIDGVTAVQKVYSIFKDSNGNVWVGGIDGDMVVFKSDGSIKSYPIKQVKSFTEESTGMVLSTGKNGVYRINPKNNEFELIENLRPSKNDLAYSSINAAIENTNGTLVLATNGEGLVFYNQKTSKINKLTIESGMPSDIVQGLLKVNENNYWASTTKGLVNVIINSKDTIIHVYDKKDGLASTEYNYGSYLKINNKKFAFGGVDGVTIFNPLEIKGEAASPRIVFDEFKLFNKVLNSGSNQLLSHINETNEITLESNENSIEIKFTGVLFGSGTPVKYSYYLEGFDKEWSTPSLSNTASYTNLNSGDYTFRVRAFNKYGIAGEERAIKMQILSPWWISNKAFVLYALLIFVLILTIIHFTSVIVKKRNADEQIDFFNNITHEIKTPLAILISSLDSITENADSGEESKRRVKTTVKRINSLFEQMLNFHKVTSSEDISQDISAINLEAHIKKRLADFKPLIEEQNIEIIVSNNWTDGVFYFDKDIFDKILLNLVSNAIKYSFENGTIYIKTYKTSLRELKIEIIDEGLGIPKDQQKYILQRYYRARNVINSQRPGTGLGLMMVKKLLEKTGGAINFESEENKGTSFTVLMKNYKEEYEKNVLSRQETIHNINDELEEHLELEDFSDSKILIVEDNDELRNLLSNTLGVYFQVYEAKNGKEGLEQTSLVYPDIILTDLIMPEMDGMQMAKKIKDDINLNHIPVFMMTVLQNSAQKIESIETGISEYIEKPVDMKFLLAKMITTLKWQKTLREKFIHDKESGDATVFRNKNNHEFLESLENKIIENIENNSFSVHDLSKSFGMSRTSLYMKLKNLVDLSPQDFIIHTKLKHAKNLLIQGESSIKEIAYKSGFSNPKYFSTSFKKFYEMTPSEFLESLKN